MFCRAFNIGAIVHLATTTDHALHPAHIISALRSLVARHDALRVTIAHNETSHSTPTLKCGSNLDKYQIATISTTTDNVQSWAVNEIRKPYDFSSQLFRFCCLQTTPNKLSLCLSFHHIAIDGSSIQILVTELLRLLTGQTLSPNPPQITSSLSPFQPHTASSTSTAMSLAGKVSGGCKEKRERIRQRWMAMLGSAKTCTRLERLREDVSETVSEWVAIKSAPFLTDVIRDVSKHFGVCPTVVMATMYSLALRTFLRLDSECMVIGCAFANRRRSQHDMVGHTVGLLPLQIDFSRPSCDLAAIIAQVNEGWCLILEGGVSLFELLPVLPCLKAPSPLTDGTTQAPSPPTGDLTRTSPLQTVLSFLSTPQKPFPKSISLQDGTRVECSLELPRSCDAHLDLFLEVRSPKNWNGEGSEVSYLFTWEYRVCCLSRSDVTFLHNLTTGFLLSAMKSCTERSMQNVALGFKGHLEPTIGMPSKEKLINSEVVANSYEFTEQLRKSNSSKLRPAGENKVVPGLWVWSSPNNNNTSVTPPKLPTLVRPPQNMSIVEGLVLQKSQNLSFIERFMMKAYEIPEQTAFRYGTRTLTYYETALMVEKLACVLIEEGVQPRDHVGLVMPHSLMLYIALLAILRCGAAYVPLSLHNPQERILAMLELADCKLLVTDIDTLQKVLHSYRGPCVRVDSEKIHNFLEISEEVPKLPQIHYHGDQIAVIIFTSGTTGTPKGVALTNYSLSHLLTNYLLLVTPHDTAVSLAGCTVAWDGHVLDSLGPLLNGSCLVVMATLNIYEGITHAFMSPSAASVVKFPDSMRSLVVGGEAFTKTCYENVKNVPKLLTVYGPTETTVFVSADFVVGPNVDGYLSNLGKPVPNMTLMVCDPSQNPVALGSEGELCIAGPLVSRVGYYKNTEKTKLVFVKSPLAQYDNVYRTGDWTRMLPDGRIVYLGRTDDQVKLRGMRFQLLEVENALRRHPQVKIATVIVRNQGSSSALLVGYVTPKSVNVTSLFKFARDHLPSYMVPSAVVTLDEMPLKTEGKIDRIALLKLGLPASTDTADTIDTTDTTDAVDTCDVNINDQGSQVSDELPNVTQIAQRLAEIFGRVLGQKSYPPTADFFTNGGQSLLLFRLLQLVKSEMKCEIQLVDLLQNSSPLSLARIIVGAPDFKSDTTTLGTRQRRKSDRMVKSGKCSVSSSQQQMSRTTVTAGSAISESEAEILNRSLEEENMIKSLVDCGLTDTTAERSGSTSAESLNDFDYLAPVPVTPLPESLVQSLKDLFGSSHTSKCRLSVEGLAKQLQSESGFYIPPASLEKYGDIDTLRTHLKLKTLLSYFQSATSPLVKLRPPSGGMDRPLIFLHGGIIGWALPYLSLAKSIDQSSIAIQRCEESPTSSFEEMAAYYVDAILAAQPRGPYRLMGVCYGALLVYEVARQLTDRGETIQLAVFVNHSPAIEKLPRLFNSDGGPLPNTFVDPIMFFRKILGLPLVVESATAEQGNVGDEGVVGGVRVGGGDENNTEVVGMGEWGGSEGGGEGGGRKREKSVDLEEMVRSLVQEIKSSPDSSWIPFTSTELESVYLGFFRRLRCSWLNYKPRPGAEIRQCVLIRDHTHPLFNSFDYSLGRLLPKDSRLSVVTTPKKMGLLSDADTFDFVRTTIIMHLQM